MSINKRIRLLAKLDNQTQVSFGKKIGISQKGLSMAFIRDTPLKANYLVAILTAYPNLSADWLMLGLGEMWREPQPAAAADDDALPQLDQGFEDYTLVEDTENEDTENESELLKLYREQIVTLKLFIKHKLPNEAKELGF